MRQLIRRLIKFPYKKTLAVSLVTASAVYAQVQYPNLPPAALPLSGSEIVALQQGGITKQAPASALGAGTSPISAPYLLQSPDGSLPQSRVLEGSGSLMVTDGGPAGFLTLSLPQSIDPSASVTFNSALLSSLTVSSLIVPPLNGIIVAHNGSPAGVASLSTIVALWGCSPASTIYMATDGSCQTAGSGGGGGNPGDPTGLIGLTAVNGSASTYTRSDAHAALDQSIAPTWTGQHTFRSNPTIFSTASSSLSPQVYCANGLASGSRCFAWNLGAGADLQLALANDSGAPGHLALDVGRSGAALSSVAVGNATDSPAIGLNGSVTFSNGGGSFGTGWDATFTPPGTSINSEYPAWHATNISSGASAAVTARLESSASTLSLTLAGTNYLGPNFAAKTGYLYTTTNAWGLCLGTNNINNALCVDGTNQGIYLRGAVGASKGPGTLNTTGLFINNVAVVTPDSGTFSGTLTGLTTSPTVTVTWVRMGQIVVLTSDTGNTGTSNANTLTMAGVPAGLIPTHNHVVWCGGMIDNNAANTLASCQIDTGGVVTALKFNGTGTYNFNVWTTSGTKGIGSNWTMTYPLN